MNKIFKYFLLFIFVITFMVPKTVQCTEENLQERQSYDMLARINSSVREFANAIQDKTGLDKWTVVNEECKSLIKQHNLEQYKINILASAISHVFSVDQKRCEAFLKIGLRFTPNPNNEAEQVELWIKDLDNPLEGKFNFLECHGLSISTGYRKKKDPAHENMTEMWFLPRFVMEEEINKTKVPYLQPIFNEWRWPSKATVGIIWTSGSASDDYDAMEQGNWRYDMGAYDYQTDLAIDVLCDKHLNLYEIWNGNLKDGRQGSKRRTRNHSTGSKAREMMKFLKLVKMD